MSLSASFRTALGRRLILVGAALAGVLTTWAPVMAQSPGWTYKVNANFGWGRSSFDTDIQTSLGTASSGGANATQWSFGGDGRVQIPMFGTWSGVVGVAGDRELSGNSTTFFDLGPGLGTTVSWRREGFVLPYGGISGRFPTVSSRMAGQAWQPGWGTFDATLYVGPRFESLSGSIATNAFGLQNFSKSVVGLTVGLDVDYPLYLSGYGGDSMGPLWPRWRTGIAVDTFPNFNVNPQLGSIETPGVMPTPALIETVRVTPKTEVRLYTGLTWTLQRNFLP